MRFLIMTVIVALLVSTVVSASFQSYSGVTRWKVDVVDDETGCGDSVNRDTRTVSIKHNYQVVSVSDLGHGPSSGTISRDVLSFPSRVISDGAGSSKLSAGEVIFSADCSSFSGGYTWNYKDSQMSCSGNTQMRGTRLDAVGCPGSGTPNDIMTQISKIRDTEKKIQEVLSRDSKDFWANWDMAEARKREGDYKEYFTYLNKAIQNDNIFADTKKKLKDEAQRQLGLSSYPTAESVPILRTVQDEVKDGMVLYNVNFAKPKENNLARLRTMVWASLVPDSRGKLYELAGIKEAGQ